LVLDYDPRPVEGYPIALLEAKSFGCCALVSDIPPHREVVRDRVDGFLFKSSEPENLTERLRWLLENPTLIEQAGIALRESMLKQPSWDDVADRTIDVCQALLNPPSPLSSPSRGEGK
jgi:glycosyltransferase involved in cell wall biosynthesis